MARYVTDLLVDCGSRDRDLQLARVEEGVGNSSEIIISIKTIID